MWSATEIPVDTAPADQVNPRVEGTVTVYNDRGRSLQGWLVAKGLFDADPTPLAGPGVVAGPDIEGGAIAWQNGNYQACRRLLAGDSQEQCMTFPTATDFSLSGTRAVATVGSGASVRLADFGTMSSKYIESSTTMGSRFGSVIEGDSVVWVRQRGNSAYYEPIIYYHNLATGVTQYMTKTGGGMNSNGGSKYARQHPTISGGRVLYQQKLNEQNTTWDIFEAIPDTFGSAVVQKPGDQMNPSLSGNIVVYQDNRTGQVDESGRWVGDWNIYMMDLNTGIEQPVCTAPGDQVNPVIDGNTVVWQDGRNGDWDIYAAVLSEVAADSQLADRYSPVLLLHHNEDFAPEDAGVMLAAPGTVLMEDGIERLRAPESLTLEALSGFGSGSFIDLPGSCVICGPRLPDPSFDKVIRSQFVQPYRSALTAGGHETTMYARVVHRGERTIIQYWLNYYFNNHPLLSHEGDWELVEVELDAGDEPSRVSVSQHSYGRMRRWQDVELSDGHPLIFVGRGSHANYFEGGPHTLELAHMPVPSIIDEVDKIEAGRLVTPKPVLIPASVLDEDGFKWMRFSGRWGEVTDLPEADPPLGPAWSGDRWEHPFAWWDLQWDGGNDLSGQAVGISARFSHAINVRIAGFTGGFGEPALADFVDGTPGGRLLDVVEENSKTLLIPGASLLSGCSLEFTTDTPVEAPLRLTLFDPAESRNLTVDYCGLELQPGEVAWLELSPQSKADGFAVQVDRDGDGAAEERLVADSVNPVAIDTTAPAAVTDLAAHRLNDGSIRLDWAAPGDDALTGTAALYSVRYASQPITEASWADAEPVAVIEPPRGAGSAETMTINDVPPGGAVYFAFRATDEAGNESAISNPASCIRPLLSLAVGSVSWASYADYLSYDLTVRFRLSNSGDGAAREVTIKQVDTGISGVTPGALPPPLAAIEPGQAADVDIRFRCPAETRRFRVRLYAVGRDVESNEMWFPEPPPVIT